jgi:hypothetical protein
VEISLFKQIENSLCCFPEFSTPSNTQTNINWVSKAFLKLSEINFVCVVPISTEYSNIDSNQCSNILPKSSNTQTNRKEPVLFPGIPGIQCTFKHTNNKKPKSRPKPKHGYRSPFWLRHRTHDLPTSHSRTSQQIDENFQDYVRTHQERQFDLETIRQGRPCD